MPEAQADARAMPRSARWAARVATAATAVAAAVVFHRPLFEGNVGVVDPGRVYRTPSRRRTSTGSSTGSGRRAS